MKSLGHKRDKNMLHLEKKKFKEEDADVKMYRKVRGHCHYTGKYRRAAHSLCSNFLLWMKL